MSGSKSINNSYLRMKPSWRIFKKNKHVVNSFSCAIAALAVLSYSSSSLAQALPTGGVVASGNPNISTSGNTMTVNQTSQFGIINWDTFSAGLTNTVDFVNGTGSTLNRVMGNTVSSIDGIITGTGSVYLINPNGLVIGPNGKVDVGGNFVGSTYNISDDDFLNGSRNFTGNGSAGTVEVRPGGMIKADSDIILVGSSLLNEGTVEGSRVTLASAGGAGSVSVQSNGDVSQILGSSNALAINNKGTIRANGIVNDGHGRVILRSTGDIENSGSLIAKSNVAKGGDINVRSNRDINLTSTSSLDASQGGTVGSNITVRAARDLYLGGSVLGNNEGIINVGAADNNWQSGRGAIVSGTVPASMRGKQIIMLSGKNEDGSRNDLGTQIASTGGAFKTLALEGFKTIDTANIASTATDDDQLKTQGGTLALVAENIEFRENVGGADSGDVLLIAGAFDDVTGDFKTTETGAGALVGANGWQGNHGTLRFLAPNEGATLLDICCHFAAKSGLGIDGSRVDLTGTQATFQYSENAQNNVLSFRVEGFNNFNLDGISTLNSSSYFIANNVNNVIDYNINAGANVPTGKVLNSYFTDLGNVEIYSGMFNSNNVFDSSLEMTGTGTTTFVGDREIKADEKIILVSGADSNGNRTDLTEAVQFGYTGTDNSYTQFKAVGFNNIALGSSLLASNALNSLGRFDLYAYNDINVSGETYSGENVLMIAHDDINIENNSTINGSQTAVLVSDESNPTDLGGNGTINLSADSEVNGGQVALYTRSQDDNNIQGTIRGLAFNPGTEFNNTNREQWQTFYANGSNPTSNGIVYYKDAKVIPPLPSNPVDCQQNPGQPECAEALRVGQTTEFMVAQTDLGGNLTNDPRLADGHSNEVRVNETQVVFGNNYVSSLGGEDGTSRLTTAERLATAVALPFPLVQQTLVGAQNVVGAVPIPGLAFIAGAITQPLIYGLEAVTPGSSK